MPSCAHTLLAAFDGSLFDDASRVNPDERNAMDAIIAMEVGDAEDSSDEEFRLTMQMTWRMAVRSQPPLRTRGLEGGWPQPRLRPCVRRPSCGRHLREKRQATFLPGLLSLGRHLAVVLMQQRFVFTPWCFGPCIYVVLQRRRARMRESCTGCSDMVF